MTGLAYLAWQHLRWHKWKTLLLIAAITMVMYLPIGLQVMIQQTAKDMTARGNSTPLVVGRRGSPLELVLNALYFSLDAPPALRMASSSTVSLSESESGTTFARAFCMSPPDTTKPGSSGRA